MPTTGGNLAFVGAYAAYDATVVRRLREVGAIILLKTPRPHRGASRERARASRAGPARAQCRPAWAARRSAHRSRIPGQSPRRRPRRAGRRDSGQGLDQTRTAAAFPSGPPRCPGGRSRRLSRAAARPYSGRRDSGPLRRRVCHPCAQRAACTTATRGGRSIAIHAQEHCRKPCARTNSTRTDARGSAKVPPWSTRSPASTRSRGTRRATKACARTRSIPTRRRYCQSPTDGPAPEGRLIIRCSAL